MNRSRLVECIAAAFGEDIRETCARQDAARLYAWLRLGALLVLAMALAGCGSTQTVTRVPPPLAVACPSECMTACAVPAGAVWRPEDPNSGAAWKLLVKQSIATLVMAIEECDTHRKACVGCIETAEQADRICGNTKACQ